MSNKKILYLMLAGIMLTLVGVLCINLSIGNKYEYSYEEQVDEEIIIEYDNYLHVYSTQSEASANNGYSSINDAINAASESTCIYIHEGIYREEIKLTNKNNIGLVAFEDDEVFVTATEEVNNFTFYKNGIYKANVDDIEVKYTQVLTNGVKGEMAKFPNRTIESNMEVFESGGGYSYLTNMYKEEGKPSYVTFAENVPNVDLTGGIFKGFIGKNREYPVGFIVSNNGNKIGFNAYTDNEWKNSSVALDDHLFGFGYIYHKNLIDIPGEWFLEDNELFYMPENGVNINNLLIEMQVRKKVLSITNSNFIEIDGIDFYGGASEIKKTTNLLMRNSSMQYLSGFYETSGYGDSSSMKTGIYVENSSELKFLNNYVGHTYGTGFYLNNVDKSVFRNCVIEDIGASGIFTSGIFTNGGDVSITKCTFNENGRFQVRVRGNGRVDIVDNVFKSSMMLGEDAGPIEFTSTGSFYPLDLKGSVIAYNQVTDVRGIPVSGLGGYLKQFVKAFYMEDVENYIAHHNLVYDIKATNSLHLIEEFPKLVLKSGLIYLGPRFNELTKPVNYYNNTAYNYDTNISIWHIEVDNYKDLNLKHNGGAMTKGSFINNAFEELEFSILYQTKKLNENQGFIGGNLTNKNEFPTNYKSDDIVEFAERLKGIDYILNPSNNILLNQEEKTKQYVNPLTGNFTLKDTSILKNAGIPINGITLNKDKTPDVGALEGSDRVLKAGCSVDFNIILPKK